jgi:hypothetical protein
MTQALYAHMNNKNIKIKKKKTSLSGQPVVPVGSCNELLPYQTSFFVSISR